MTDALTTRPATPNELCKLVGCSRPVIDKAVHDGVIPHFRLGRRIFIPRGVVTEMLTNGRIPHASDDATSRSAGSTL